MKQLKQFQLPTLAYMALLDYYFIFSFLLSMVLSHYSMYGREEHLLSTRHRIVIAFIKELTDGFSILLVSLNI